MLLHYYCDMRENVAGIKTGLEWSDHVIQSRKSKVGGAT
jgi:hypothetical protein